MLSGMWFHHSFQPLSMVVIFCLGIDMFWWDAMPTKLLGFLQEHLGRVWRATAAPGASRSSLEQTVLWQFESHMVVHCLCRSFCKSFFEIYIYIYYLHTSYIYIYIYDIYIYIWVFPKIGWAPKMDGENNGKPYEQMDDLGGNPTI